MHQYLHLEILLEYKVQLNACWQNILDKKASEGFLEESRIDQCSIHKNLSSFLPSNPKSLQVLANPWEHMENLDPDKMAELAREN